MTVNLPQLRAFLAVVDAGGFSAAAAELGMSQSAVSHAVASLERELAAPLLVRATPVRTTVLGEQVLPHARIALSAVRSVEQIAADATETMTGTVRLASTPTVCQGLIPGLLRHWREDQPRITVRVFEGDSSRSLGLAGERDGRCRHTDRPCRPAPASSSPRTATAPCCHGTIPWPVSRSSTSATWRTTSS